MGNYILIYFVVINILTLIFYKIDKVKAKKGKWRISENTLLGLALIGGSIGALSGMYLFHHKTKKMKFTVGVPAIIVLQCLILIWLMA